MKRVGDVLSAIFDQDLLQKARGYSAMFNCWKDLTEKNNIAAAADHSWIKSLDRGLVWIEVDHPGWKQILQTKESKLLSDFRRRFPDMDISGLSIILCRPGARPENTENEPAAKTTAPPDRLRVASPAAAEENAPPKGYDAIKESALKDALMRLEQGVASRNV